MEAHEIGLLLTYANRLDPRVQVNKEAVALWAESVSNLETQDARTAVEAHYRASDKSVMPSHVVVLARAARDRRKLEEARESARWALPPAAPAGAPGWFKAWREAGADPARIQEFEGKK
jgi:hypothetical protein